MGCVCVWFAYMCLLFVFFFSFCQIHTLRHWWSRQFITGKFPQTVSASFYLFLETYLTLLVCELFFTISISILTYFILSSLPAVVSFLAASDRRYIVLAVGLLMSRHNILTLCDPLSWRSVRRSWPWLTIESLFTSGILCLESVWFKFLLQTYYRLQGGSVLHGVCLSVCLLSVGSGGLA